MAVFTGSCLLLRRLLSRRLLSSPAPVKTTKTRDTLGSALFSSLVVGTGGLSAWQAQRYSWKCELVTSRTKALAAEPEPLAELLAREAQAPAEYTRVSVRGRLDHAHQMLVGPRGPPAGAPVGPAVHSGWYVVTPLHGDDGLSVLVNRGWVARDRVEEVSQPSGEVTLECVVRAAEEPGSLGLPRDPKTGSYFWIDPAGMALDAELFSSVPLLVEETAPRDQGVASTWPRTRQLSSLLAFRVEPSMHLVYAATWATLSLASAAMTVIRFR